MVNGWRRCAACTVPNTTRFAAIINGDGAAKAEIVRGMQRVVVARLRDAAFFLAEDRSVVEGGKQERVKAVFYPKREGPQGGDAKAAPGPLCQ